MSNFPRFIEDKYCFVQCPPEQCNCRRGNPLEWRIQQKMLGIDEEDSYVHESDKNSGEAP